MEKVNKIIKEESMPLPIDKDKHFKYQVNEKGDGLNILIPFEVKNNCCITYCEHHPYYVGGVNCQKCTYYEGEIEKENKVKCSHPETEDESTKEKK